MLNARPKFPATVIDIETKESAPVDLFTWFSYNCDPLPKMTTYIINYRQQFANTLSSIVSCLVTVEKRTKKKLKS